MSGNYTVLISGLAPEVAFVKDQRLAVLWKAPGLWQSGLAQRLVEKLLRGDR